MNDTTSAGRVVVADHCRQGRVDLAGDVALEAVDDIGLGQAFVGPSFYVGGGAGLVAQPAEDDDVEGSTALRLPSWLRRCRWVGPAACEGRGCAAHVRERGLGDGAIGVVVHAVINGWPATSGPTPGSASRLGGLADELIQVLIGLTDVRGQMLVASRESA